MNVYLCGMIGSGKTTVGSAVAERLGVPFVDLDREMDGRLGYSFHRLVAEQGWLAFRELEYSICKHFATLCGTIVGLGGGTIRYEWNRDAIRGTGPVVLFEASEEALIDRVSVADRPRVNANTDLAEDIRTMWRLHADRYRSAADLVYRTDRKTVDEEVDEVYGLLSSDPMFAGFRAAIGGPGAAPGSMVY